MAPTNDSIGEYLQVSYWRYWRLAAAPFGRAADQPLFRGGTVEEALARIEFLISNRRSIGSLLGVSGVGKSSVLRYFATHPTYNAEVPNLNVICLSMLGLAGGELYFDLASRLIGTRQFSSRHHAWKSLCDYFLAASREDVHSVLLVDDAESSCEAAEADLCRLLALDFPLTIVFSAESRALPAISRGLIERVELQIELPGWDISQTAEFLAWNFSRLGRTEPIFTDTAVDRIHQLSQGVVRRVIQLTDLALVAGAVAQADCVDADCVDQVAWELPRSNAA